MGLCCVALRALQGKHGLECGGGEVAAKTQGAVPLYHSAYYRRWNPASSSRQALIEANQRCKCTVLWRILRRFHPRVHFPPTVPHAPSHRPLNSRPQCVTAVQYSKPKHSGLIPLVRCLPPCLLSTRPNPRLGPSIPTMTRLETRPWPNHDPELAVLPSPPMADNFRSLPQAGRCLAFGRRGPLNGR